jgi:hypothetical protein
VERDFVIEIAIKGLAIEESLQAQSRFVQSSFHAVRLRSGKSDA